ncbi:MAG: FAD-binding oxidoreductase [Aquisalinus sp.]|nr:FAD-binding oxidoreductase [Aquisalinus sp.]
MSILILGAGIVGVSAAVQLQQRGEDVILVDQAEPGMGASFGNAGMIHGEAVFPLPFPRKLSELLEFGLNRTPALHYHLRALPALAPFLAQYWWHSSPARHRKIADAYAALTLKAQAAHLALAEAAGATELIRHDGCYTIFRSAKGEQAAIAEAEQAAQHSGINYQVLDADAYGQREPHVTNVSGAVHWQDSLTVTDPHHVVTAYFNLYKKLGGHFIKASAEDVRASTSGWSLSSSTGAVEGKTLIVALGARSGEFTRLLGYQFPLRPKRGYHLHYTPDTDRLLNHTIIDRENGFSLAPMTRGIRLTTGIEFARNGTAPTPVQISRSEKSARQIFDLGRAEQAAPWMGERPCLPDMLPVIGKAPDRDNLWFAFGHGHQGFTMGPITGQLIAEIMTGDKPVIDPHPYRADRFPL